MLNRREFLFGLAGLAAAAPMISKGSEFEENYDVIVVGSGISAQICACYLAKNKAKVLMLEKMTRIGGNSVISQQDFAVACSDVQKALGIKDSVELFVKDLNKAGKGYNDPEHTLRLAKGSNEAYEFAKSCGIKYEKELKKLGGHSVPRSLISVGGGGAAVRAAHEHFISLGGEIKRACKVDEILKDEHGKVVGVRARENYRFDKSLKNESLNTSGEQRLFGAKAVIFATGGFSGDSLFRTLLNPRLKFVGSPSSAGQNADALKTLLKAGATPVQLALTRFSFGIPTEDLVYGMLVDSRGERFMSEAGDRQSLSNAILEHMNAINTPNFPVLIFDSAGFLASHDPERMKSFLNAGKLKKFDSLKALSAAFNLPADALAQSAAKYQKGLDEGRDEFNKDIAALKGAGMQKAPFYAILAAPNLSYTQGGVGVCPKSMGVLDMLSLEPINGLYAIGEATGGIHGFSRLTSCSVPDCMTGALLAAKSVLANLI